VSNDRSDDSVRTQNADSDHRQHHGVFGELVRQDLAKDVGLIRGLFDSHFVLLLDYYWQEGQIG